MKFLRVLWACCGAVILLLWSPAALAGVLSDRVAQFPQWESLPPVQTAQGDLVYPAWFTGTWQVTTTLVDLAAPLAPEIVTPGFEQNRKQLNQPVEFAARFVPGSLPSRVRVLEVPQVQSVEPAIVADRAFNGLNLAKASLGDRAVQSVTVDPDDPNRQITQLQGGQQLLSVVTGRATESPDDTDFVTTEVFQQVFRTAQQVYLNQVESTTAYHHSSTPIPSIQADQVTAIYLSPQDPHFFAARGRPVALYRYHLNFVPLSVPLTVP